MTPLRAPFPWIGGKRKAAALVWERFGRPRRYIEPFAGSLAVLIGRPDEPRVEIVNDADGMVANFWRAVAGAPREVARWADWPVSEVDLHARHTWLVAARAELTERLLADPGFFDAQVAGWWVWGASCWIGGRWCADPKGARVHRRIPAIAKEGGGVHNVHLHRRRPQLNNGGGACGVATTSYAGLRRWMGALARRLRHVKVVCGDWRRVITPACLGAADCTTAIFLDPPYSLTLRDQSLYPVDTGTDAKTGEPLSAAVRAWAIEHGRNPRLRIALCGLEGEHAMPADWTTVAWTSPGGWGNQGQGRGRRNRHLERIWFSPACLDTRQLVIPGCDLSTPADPAAGFLSQGDSDAT